MARGRRPPDFRTTIGSLVQSALEQVGAVRDVVERGAQTQRHRLDAVRLQRKRRDALASLGEAVYRLAVQGRLGPLADEAEIEARIAEIDDLDQQIEMADESTHEDTGGFAANAGWPKPREAVSAFSGSAAARRRRSSEPVRMWRPVPPGAAPAAGTPSEPAEPSAPLPATPTAPHRAPRRSAPPPVTGRGISFDDDWDEDLEEYMHEDDIPKPGDET